MDRRKQIQGDRYRETYREADTRGQIHGHRYREIDTDRYVEEKICIKKNYIYIKNNSRHAQVERYRHTHRERDADTHKERYRETRTQRDTCTKGDTERHAQGERYRETNTVSNKQKLNCAKISPSVCN